MLNHRAIDAKGISRNKEKILDFTEGNFSKKFR